MTLTEMQELARSAVKNSPAQAYLPAGYVSDENLRAFCVARRAEIIAISRNVLGGEGDQFDDEEIYSLVMKNW